MTLCKAGTAPRESSNDCAQLQRQPVGHLRAGGFILSPDEGLLRARAGDVALGCDLNAVERT